MPPPLPSLSVDPAQVIWDGIKAGSHRPQLTAVQRQELGRFANHRANPQDVVS